MTDKYRKGTIPIEDTHWKAETVKGNEFVTLGTFTVRGSTVSRAMDEHRFIKGYEPYDIAKSRVHRKYPKANPIIVTQIYP
jgi:hypothetical protein